MKATGIAVGNNVEDKRIVLHFFGVNEEISISRRTARKMLKDVQEALSTGQSGN